MPLSSSSLVFSSLVCGSSLVFHCYRDAQRRFPDAIKRVAILDWDVHHGDGTQAIFEADPSVLMISMHRFHQGFFPGTGAAAEVGAGPGLGYTLNVPFPGGKYGDKEYLGAVDALIMPVLSSFAPDLVLVSAGMDCLRGDPLGGMDVTPRGLAAVVARLRSAALPTVRGRVVAVLEGGYEPNAVACGVAAVVAALGDIAPLCRDPGTDVDFDNLTAVDSADITATDNSASASGAGGGRNEARAREFRMREAGRVVAETAKKLANTKVWPELGIIARNIDKFGLEKTGEMVMSSLRKKAGVPDSEPAASGSSNKRGNSK